MKKLISMLGFLSLMLSLAPVTSAATYDVLNGATSDLDYVYSQTQSVVDRTGQAQTTDKDYVQVFGAIGTDNQFLYMGMANEKFDKLVFSVDTAASYEDRMALDWEYNTGSTWKNLSITSGVAGFTETGYQTLAFDIPSDWNKASFETRTAYWIRVKPQSVVRSYAWMDQISARAYNVKLTVKDAKGSYVSDLDLSDFSLSNGSDNYIYAYRSLGSGVYEFAINAEAGDVNYTMTIDDSRFSKKTLSIGSVGSTVLSYNVSLGGQSSSNPPVIPSSTCDMPFRDLYGHWAAGEVEDLYCRGIVAGRSYYYFEPNDDVTRAEFLKMVLLNAGVNVDSYRQYGESYYDVNSSDWFYVYAIAGRRLGIIDNSSSFRPEDSINRAEAVAMLVRLADISLNGSYVPFSDVSSTSWYSKYVRAAYYDDVVEGYLDGTFKPGNDLTRAEAAVVVDNAYEAWYR